MVLEAGSPRLRNWQTGFLAISCFLVHRWCLLAVSSCGRRGRQVPVDRFHKGPHEELVPPWPNHLPEASPTNQYTISVYRVRGTRAFRTYQKVS
jgi:hypothetical protein